MVAEGSVRMEKKLTVHKLLVYILIGIFLIGFAYMARGLYYGVMTVHKLLAENKQLKQAITNLTQEDQIGYAKVTSQETKEGKLFTTVKFVETARDDKLKKILEKDCTIEGDIIHFDALIIKFGDKMVMDGKSRALYLWRRVYGEKMTPESGFAIEQQGTEPERYKDLLKILPVKERELFWSAIWDLANNPERLKMHGIAAIYGNVTYSKLTKGFVYIFKINSAGQIYPEVVPEM